MLRVVYQLQSQCSRKLKFNDDLKLTYLFSHTKLWLEHCVISRVRLDPPWSIVCSFHFLTNTINHTFFWSTHKRCVVSIFGLPTRHHHKVFHWLRRLCVDPKTWGTYKSVQTRRTDCSFIYIVQNSPTSLFFFLSHFFGGFGYFTFYVYTKIPGCPCVWSLFGRQANEAR